MIDVNLKNMNITFFINMNFTLEECQYYLVMIPFVGHCRLKVFGSCFFLMD